MNYISYQEAQDAGYRIYAGPYKPQTENWMIERAVADIEKNGRDQYALVKHGSQVSIYILPNFYLTTTFHGPPFITIHDSDEDQEQRQQLPGVDQEQVEEKAETVWAATLEEVAGAKHNEGTMAPAVSAGEGGSPLPADS